MWAMIAESGLRCAECRHNILPGRLGLSQVPEETPAGVSRGDFRNYCIGCLQCWAQSQHACYVRRLDAGGGRSAGEKAGVDIYYDWPGQAARNGVRRWSTALIFR